MKPVSARRGIKVFTSTSFTDLMLYFDSIPRIQSVFVISLSGTSEVVVPAGYLSVFSRIIVSLTSSLTDALSSSLSPTTIFVSTEVIWSLRTEMSLRVRSK